jgi:hypothetical protein
VRARHNGVEEGNAPCPRFQDQEQLSVSLARRSNAVSPLRFGSGHFSRMPDKKSRRLAGFYCLRFFSRLATDAYQPRCPVVRRIGRLRFVFGAVG